MLFFLRTLWVLGESITIQNFIFLKHALSLLNSRHGHSQTLSTTQPLSLCVWLFLSWVQDRHFLTSPHCFYCIGSRSGSPYPGQEPTQWPLDSDPQNQDAMECLHWVEPGHCSWGPNIVIWDSREAIYCVTLTFLTDPTQHLGDLAYNDGCVISPRMLFGVNSKAKHELHLFKGRPTLDMLIST